jgi:3-oxoacyl-[acyl-carrier-protein] synthase II
MLKRRVVVTGLGMVSPLGVGCELSWQNILAGKSGVRLIDHFDTSDFTTKFAGLVPDFDVADFMDLKEAKKCDPFIQYGIAAGKEAIENAGLDKCLDSLNLLRVGVIMGSGIGGIGTIEQNTLILQDSGPRRVSPFFIPASIVNMISGHLSIMYGFRGLNLALATACTTGTHAIGLAFRSIAYGDADVIIAGGAEKASTPLAIAGFAAARALSRRNEQPEQASRPWDRDRDGFVLGDGAGALVLEEYEHAKRRGAKIFAEVVGFGMSADAFHITRPSGLGAEDAMRLAIKDANLPTNAVNYVNAHGTSTKAGDIEESEAIKRVLGEHAFKILVSSTKSMTGHLLGAAGAIEAIFSILAIRDQIAPPTINLDNLDDGADLDYVANKARHFEINVALSNSFGFGGTNGTLVFKKYV